MTASFDPLVESSMEVSYGDDIIDEKMDIECLEGSCFLIFKFKNTGTLPQTPSALQVPNGYDVFYNSCNRSLLPRRTCYVRLKVKETAEDLAVGEISLNVGGVDVSKTVRLVKEEDEIAPEVSLSVVNALESGGNVFVPASLANLRIFLSDNRLEKGVEYTLSSGNGCSSTNWISTTTAEHFVDETINPTTGSMFSVRVRDALGNTSSCVPVEIKSLSSTWPSGTTDVVVASGQTLNLTAGTIYNYRSLTVEAGGTLNIQGQGMVLLGSVGDVVINGNIISNKNNFAGSSFSLTEPITGIVHSASTSQASGGSGGAGGLCWRASGNFTPNNGCNIGGATTHARSSGGASSSGLGGGGGGGNTYITRGGNGATGNNNGASGPSSSWTTGGIGGTGNAGNGGGPISSNTRNGGAGAGAGGGGSHSAGGGGGGQRGNHSNHLIIKTWGSIEGSGNITLTGTNGQAGGKGGNCTAGSYSTAGGGGGGGGGGAGGSGGHFRVYYKESNSFSGNLNLNGGTGGSAGGFGTGCNGSTTDGIIGNAGSNGASGASLFSLW